MIVKNQIYNCTWIEFTYRSRFELPSGSSIGYHKHEGNCEMIFILEGEGKVLFDDKEFSVKPGEVLYCPEGHSHSLINNGTEDLVFYAVVPKQ